MKNSKKNTCLIWIIGVDLFGYLWYISKMINGYFASGDFTGSLFCLLLYLVVKLWNLSTHQCIGSLAAHSMGIGGICFAPAGDALFTCSADKVIKRWDVRFDAYVNDALVANSFKAVFLLLIDYLAYCNLSWR